jgi:hypothetical protein
MRLRARLSLCLTCLVIACQTTGPTVFEARYAVHAPNGLEGHRDTFRIVLRDSAETVKAERGLRGGPAQVVAGRLRAGDGGFNPPWHWHLDPDSTWLADMAIELCQGSPSAVEHELEAWLKYGLLCVTPAEIVTRER